MSKTALEVVLLGRHVGGIVGIHGQCAGDDWAGVDAAERAGWIAYLGVIGPDHCYEVTQKGWDALTIATENNSG